MSSRLLHRETWSVGLPLLLATLGLIGCSTLDQAVEPANPSVQISNWQIQTGNEITATPTGAVFLAGAMQIQGNQATGTFNTHSVCGNPSLLSYTGTYNSTTGALTLADAAVSAAPNVQLSVPSKQTTPSTGSISALGQNCALALGNTPAVGVEIPSLTGTYTGTLSSPAGVTGQATLSVTQSPTPNASAQFPVNGSLFFASSSGLCGDYAPVTGTISGAAYTLSSAVISQDTISGASNVGGATLPGTTVVIADLCNARSAAYTGTLTKQ